MTISENKVEANLSDLTNLGEVVFNFAKFFRFLSDLHNYKQNNFTLHLIINYTWSGFESSSLLYELTSSFLRKSLSPRYLT